MERFSPRDFVFFLGRSASLQVLRYLLNSSQLDWLFLVWLFWGGCFIWITIWFLGRTFQWCPSQLPGVILFSVFLSWQSSVPPYPLEHFCFEVCYWPVCCGLGFLRVLLVGFVISSTRSHVSSQTFSFESSSGLYIASAVGFLFLSRSPTAGYWAGSTRLQFGTFFFPIYRFYFCICHRHFHT